MRPLLAAPLDFDRLRYPVLVSPKIDGIRALTMDDGIYSRSMKLLPNRQIQFEAKAFLRGVDGEIVVGSPTDPNCMQNTSSGVMSYDGRPGFRYLVFDVWNRPSATYQERIDFLENWCSVLGHPRMQLVRQQICHTREEVVANMHKFIDQGYEGLIARSPTGMYKNGRSTVREGYLLKYKVFASEWGKVVGFEEFLSNDNPLTTDELGYAERSSHKANMIPRDTLGSLIIESPKWPGTFTVGSGFDMVTRQEVWDNRSKYLGRTIEFKYQPHGILNVPRTPIFKSFREDM